MPTLIVSEPDHDSTPSPSWKTVWSPPVLDQKLITTLGIPSCISILDTLPRMCGRNSINASLAEIRQHYGIESSQLDQWQPSTNIAPAENTPIAVTNSPLHLAKMRWGFVPQWADDREEWKQKTIINARVESVDENGVFRDAFDQQRCLVPSTGFYEWQGDRGSKQPYLIKPDDQLFSFAGVYHEGTYAILTRDAATDDMKAVHSREPIVIPQGYQDQYLSGEVGKEALMRLSRPDFSFDKVPKKINDPENDGDDALRFDARQQSIDSF